MSKEGAKAPFFFAVKKYQKSVNKVLTIINRIETINAWGIDPDKGDHKMTNEKILEICGQAQNQDEALVMLMKHGLGYTEAKAEMEAFFQRIFAAHTDIDSE